jgi:hypothetical protein
MVGYFMKRNIVIFALIVLLSGLSYSQQIIGKIYTKQEADSLYGPVLDSIPVQSNILSGLLTNSIGYIMFRIENGIVYIADNKRQPLYPSGLAVNPNDEFRVFSISLVALLIKNGNNPITFFETRNNGIISLNNGSDILEYGSLCPPYCY